MVRKSVKETGEDFEAFGKTTGVIRLINLITPERQKY
jgi:hypothetical protein